MISVIFLIIIGCSISCGNEKDNHNSDVYENSCPFDYLPARVEKSVSNEGFRKKSTSLETSISGLKKTISGINATITYEDELRNFFNSSNKMDLNIDTIFSTIYNLKINALCQLWKLYKVDSSLVTKNNLLEKLTDLEELIINYREPENRVTYKGIYDSRRFHSDIAYFLSRLRKLSTKDAEVKKYIRTLEYLQIEFASVENDLWGNRIFVEEINKKWLEIQPEVEKKLRTI